MNSTSVRNVQNWRVRALDVVGQRLQFVPRDVRRGATTGAAPPLRRASPRSATRCRPCLADVVADARHAVARAPRRAAPSSSESEFSGALPYEPLLISSSVRPRRPGLAQKPRSPVLSIQLRSTSDVVGLPSGASPWCRWPWRFLLPGPAGANLAFAKSYVRCESAVNGNRVRISQRSRAHMSSSDASDGIR